MRIYDIIHKKRHSQSLSKEEIDFFVKEYTKGNIPDYQASALCMAICCNGMTDEECFNLTDSMMHSGDIIDLSSLPYTAAKHSTGGVGDLTSLIVTPILATLGLSVAKMSGRGLGHTGGTIDKLESIPGFRTSLSAEEFMEQVKRIGLCVIGQTENLAPADKKLYALRDVTATIDSIPLIASSIMSKKLAAGTHNIVLDVKYGSGAFISDPDEAVKLANTMVKIGRMMGKNVCAVVTSMAYPLGRKIGNSLEIIEATEILRCEDRGDALTVSVELASILLSITKGIDMEEAVRLVNDSLDSGKAYRKFLEWIEAQGGDSVLVDKGELCIADFTLEVEAEKDGYIFNADTEGIGMASCILGAGRTVKEEQPDLSAGLILNVSLGDKVKKGQSIAKLFSSSPEKLIPASEKLKASIMISEHRPETLPPLIYKKIF